MTGDISIQRGKVSPESFDIAKAIGNILPRGHVIHGYSSAGSNRMLMVLESRRYSDQAPLLGFGIDGNAERALCRALMTYALRERDGLEHITEKQYPESHQGQMAPGGHPSRFDNIVWGGDFWLHQDGTEVVAGSTYGGGRGIRPLEVRAAGALAAISLLANTYEFGNPELTALPAISLV